MIQKKCENANLLNFWIFRAKIKHILEVNHLHFVMTDLAIWWEKKSVINHLCYHHLSPSSSQFSMMISQLSLEMSIARKNAFVISQNKGCQILGAPLYILSFQFSNKILSQFYIVLWTSRAMKLLSGTVTSCPDFHIRIHKKNNGRNKNKHFEFSRQKFKIS